MVGFHDFVGTCIAPVSKKLLLSKNFLHFPVYQKKCFTQVILPISRHFFWSLSTEVAVQFFFVLSEIFQTESWADKIILLMSELMQRRKISVRQFWLYDLNHSKLSNIDLFCRTNCIVMLLQNYFFPIFLCLGHLWLILVC